MDERHIAGMALAIESMVDEEAETPEYTYKDQVDKIEGIKLLNPDEQAQVIDEIGKNNPELAEKLELSDGLRVMLDTWDQFQENPDVANVVKESIEKVEET